MTEAYHVRWMSKKDIDEVAEIDAASFEPAWAASDLLHTLGKTNVFGMVAESRDGSVAGYMVYHFADRDIHLDRFAVAPDHRRRGVGSALIRQLQGKLGAMRKRICISVPDRNLSMQLMLRSCDVPAVSITPAEDGSDDVFEFHYRLPKPETQEVA